MGKPVAGVLPPGVMEAYNNGYGDGYGKKQLNSSDGTYLRAYITGLEDRVEDDEAIESGTYEPLTEEERVEIYGDNSDPL